LPTLSIKVGCGLSDFFSSYTYLNSANTRIIGAVTINSSMATSCVVGEFINSSAAKQSANIIKNTERIKTVQNIFC